MGKSRRKVGQTGAEPPTSSCLLICDDVIMSTARGKHALQGVVNGIAVRELPALVGPYVAYVRLSNVYGSQKIQLKFAHGSTDDEVFSFEAEAPEQSDPLGVHTLILKIPQFEITADGRYLFSAVHNGVPFASSPIVVKGPGSEDSEGPTP